MKIHKRDKVRTQDCGANEKKKHFYNKSIFFMTKCNANRKATQNTRQHMQMKKTLQYKSSKPVGGAPTERA